MKRRHVSAAAVAAGQRLQRAGLLAAPLPTPTRTERRAAERAARKGRSLYHPLTWRGEGGER